MSEHVDNVLATFKAGADTAGQVLASAHELLGDTPLEDAASVARLGPAASEAWGSAKDAAKVIRSITKGWYALAELTGKMPSTPPQTLQLADVTLGQYEKLGRSAEPWSIVQAGVAIDLADRVVIKQREQRINTEREERSQRASTVFAAGYQRHAGIGKVLR